MLRPGYKPADRKAIAGPVLDSLYAKEWARTASNLRGKNGTLMLDGWSTPSNDPVIAISITVQGSAFLLGAEDTSGCPHTAEYLRDIAIEYLRMCTEELGVTVTSVCTDSAANMVKMKDLLLQLHPGLIMVPCQAHWLNLLAKDLLKDKPQLQQIVTILQWFDRNHMAHASLREKNITLPPLPCDTRWSSHYHAVCWYNRHWAALVEVAASLLFQGAFFFNPSHSAPLLFSCR